METASTAYEVDRRTCTLLLGDRVLKPASSLCECAAPNMSDSDPVGGPAEVAHVGRVQRACCLEDSECELVPLTGLVEPANLHDCVRDHFEMRSIRLQRHRNPVDRLNAMRNDQGPQRRVSWAILQRRRGCDQLVEHRLLKLRFDEWLVIAHPPSD